MELERFFGLLFGEEAFDDNDTGFAWLSDLGKYHESFYLGTGEDRPEKFRALIDAAYWGLNQKLYASPLLYSDGRVEEYTDEHGKKRIKTGRRKENAKTARVVFLDADEARPDQMRLEPSVIVYSSPGRHQLHWALDKPYPAAQVIEVVNMISTAHLLEGADSSSGNTAKLLLVPGCINSKRHPDPYPDHPELAGKLVHPEKPQVTARFTDKVYTLDEIREAYSDISIDRPQINVEEYSDAPELLDFQPIFDKLPEYSPRKHQDWNELFFKKTPDTVDRSELRYLVICELIRSGLTTHEVFSAAWYADSTSKWREDPRGTQGLWDEVIKAEAEIMLEQGIGVDAPESGISTVEAVGNLSLLNDEERVAIRESRPFVDIYCEWAQSQLRMANMPYHRMNAWLSLYLAFGDNVLYLEDQKLTQVNLWCMIWGDSGSGKSDAKDIAHRFWEGVAPFGFKAAASLAPDAHIKTLKETILDREGALLMWADEAHGVLSQMLDGSSGGWTKGAVEGWTDLFDGKVIIGASKSAGKPRGDSGNTTFGIQFIGTPEKMASVLNRDMFDSGFLPRFVWVIGDEAVDDTEMMRPKQGSISFAALGTDDFVEHYAKKFDQYRRDLFDLGSTTKRNTVDRKYIMEWDTESLRRAGDAIVAIYKSIPSTHKKSLQTSSRRIGMHIRKIATLNCVSRGGYTVTLIDVLVAIEAVEEWWKNLLKVVDAVSTGERARQQEDILNFVKNAGGQVSNAQIYLQFRDWGKDLRALLEEMIWQGRLAFKGGDFKSNPNKGMWIAQ